MAIISLPLPNFLDSFLNLGYLVKPKILQYLALCRVISRLPNNRYLELIMRYFMSVLVIFCYHKDLNFDMSKLKMKNTLKIHYIVNSHVLEHESSKSKIFGFKNMFFLGYQKNAPRMEFLMIQQQYGLKKRLKDYKWLVIFFLICSI